MFRGHRIITFSTEYTMLRLAYISIVFLAFSWSIYGFKYKQNGAIIKTCDPQYFASCSALTRRMKRGDPYRTNVTFTLLSPFVNNCTLKCIFQQKGHSEAEIFKTKTCDAMRHQWFVDFFHKFTNIKDSCDMKAGTYHFWNIELPPKNFPIPLPPGDAVAKFLLIPTSNEKIILDMTIKVYT